MNNRRVAGSGTVTAMIVARVGIMNRIVLVVTWCALGCSLPGAPGSRRQADSEVATDQGDSPTVTEAGDVADIADTLDVEPPDVVEPLDVGEPLDAPDVIDAADVRDVPDVIDTGACDAPWGLCSGFCVDFASDLNNCRICSRRCVNGTICSLGNCLCPPAQTVCAGACVDALTNAAHCGRCNNACPSPLTCVAGFCR